jgi:hypothetical protein
MNSQDAPPKMQANSGSALENLKVWLTELGIDCSNFEELVMQDNEINKKLNVAYEDSKSKSKPAYLSSIPAYRHHVQEPSLV